MSAQSAQPPCEHAHSLERDVCRELQSHDDMHFSSLVVRRMDDGAVCLEGVVQIDNTRYADVELRAKSVRGVDAVLNHLVVQPETPLSE